MSASYEDTVYSKLSESLMKMFRLFSIGFVLVFLMLKTA